MQIAGSSLDVQIFLEHARLWSKRSKSPAANTEQPFVPRQNAPTKQKLPYRNTGIDFMEVAVRYVRTSQPPFLPSSSFPLFPAENGPREFFTRFHLTYSAKSSAGKLSRSTRDLGWRSFFHTFPIRLKINSPPEPVNFLRAAETNLPFTCGQPITYIRYRGGAYVYVARNGFVFLLADFLIRGFYYRTHV